MLHLSRDTVQTADGTVASAESGERFYEEITKAVAEMLRVFHEMKK
jgi:creatinine amidohydrolase/Fe(II)-dependent formamide hydrolase-like protein